MDKQSVDFYTEVKDGVVQKIGRSVIDTPRIVIKEDSRIKWYEDKIKVKLNNTGSLQAEIPVLSA